MASYETISADVIHGWFRDLLPGPQAAVFDIGAGSGRDAAWLAALGYEVVAAEPASAMRMEAARLHPTARISWTDDALPDLAGVLRAGLSFDFVLVSAVWQHVHPSLRSRAFRKITSVLKPGALVVLTLRHGPDTDGRSTHPVSAEEIEVLARDHGLRGGPSQGNRGHAGSGRRILDFHRPTPAG